MSIRLRFAPSPTGYLHIGGLRTALYNFLYARQKDGKFIIRIEDTDQTRFVEGALENLLEALVWSGIEIDEGAMLEGDDVIQKGEHQSYIQSERVAENLYRPYVDKLIDEDHAYYCFCTKERLDQLRESQRADGVMPKYDGLCRGVSMEEAKERISSGEEHVIRMKLPHDVDVEFNDLVRGHMSINTNDFDDQVLIKSDGFPTYHMAVVVDDYLMEISHIVRGEEWLSSTPKHVLLYEWLGWEQPVYVHLPAVLNKDYKKLSKRHGDVAVEDFRAQGYLPEALINYLALVGWSPDSNQEIFTMDELIEAFDFSRVQNSGGIFDRNKLDWVNAQHIKNLSDAELAAKIKPILLENNMIEEDIDEKWLELLANTYKDNLDTLNEIVEKARIIFLDLDEINDEKAEEYLKSDEAKILAEALIETIEDIEDLEEEAQGIMKKVQKSTDIRGKALFMTSRVLITGSVNGPDLWKMLILYGKEELLNRLKSYNFN